MIATIRILVVIGICLIGLGAASSAGAQTVPSSLNTGLGSTFFDQWSQRVDAASATQPAWPAPLVMATPRIVQLFRFDTSLEEVRTGAMLTNYGVGRGISLVPTETNQIALGIPSYMVRAGGRAPGSGFGDLPAFTIKQRLLSANAQSGNYILTSSLSGTAPTGSGLFTQDAYTITPALFGGKGWGRFDVQASAGVTIPLSHENTIGTAAVTNLVLQYRLTRVLWPEIELNQTYWLDGVRGGKVQTFLTAGLIVGRFALSQRVNLTVGVGYQAAITPAYETKPEVTPAYARAVITTFRLSF